MKRKRQLIILLLISLLSSLSAQDYKVVEDFELWAGAKYRYKILDNKLCASFEAEGRFRKDASEFKSIFIEPVIEYELAKWVDFGVAFRYTKHNTWKGEKEDLYRISAFSNFKYDIDRFKLSYRLQFQNSDNDLLRRDDINYAENILRNRLMLRYKIKKSRFTPYVSSEVFTSVVNSELNSYNLRLTLGSNITINKKLKMKVFYRVDQELNSDYRYKIYIAGVRFIFTSKN